MPAKKLPRAAPGKPVVIDAAVWNALCDEVERLGRLTVSPPLYKDRDNPAGINLSVAGGGGDPGFWAKIISSSQDGGHQRWAYGFSELDKPGAGYGTWGDLSGGRSGTAYNAWEDQETLPTTALPNATRVWVKPTKRADDGSTEYWITGINPTAATAPPGNFIVLVQANAAGGGTYTGTIYDQGTFAKEASGDLSLPSGLEAGDPCLIVNADENDQPTHWIVTGDYGSYATCYFSGEYTTGDDYPLPIMIVTRARYRADEEGGRPILGSDAERTTAATDTWTSYLTTSGGDKGDGPVSEWGMTGLGRVSGTAKVQALARKRTWAADGRLVSITDETGYELNGLFCIAVKVTKTGGAAGSPTTTCAYVYTVKDLAGNTLATSQTPACPRFSHCEYLAPADDSPGLAYYDAAGTLVLYHVAGEVPKTDEVTAVTDYRVDGGSMKFQKKTRTLLVLEAGTESDWTDVHTGSDECDEE